MADTKALSAGVRKIAAAVPTNWLDSILTGPKAVVSQPPWGCPDVERILNAVRERVTAVAMSELSKARIRGTPLRRRRSANGEQR